MNNNEQGFSNAEQGFVNNKRIMSMERGHSGSKERCFGDTTDRGFIHSERGFGNMNRGFSNVEQGFESSGYEARIH